MSLSKRKHVQLTNELESLCTEFKFWREQSEPKQPLEKHHTQIRRITAQLAGLVEEIGKQMQCSDRGEENLLSKSMNLEYMILEVHRIWQFFRGKLLQRGTQWFQSHLAAADDFAWECYRAATEEVNESHISPEQLKEPPLVFFNGCSSPYTASRDFSYRPEEVPYEGIKTPEFIKVLKRLPIPVIGIPWFQMQHLPDLLLIAHEVGHNVEDDLHLTERITDNLEKEVSIPVERKPAWKAWHSEIFADFYGVLAAGPAFVSTLIDFIAKDQQQIASERLPVNKSWGEYPTTSLRIFLVLEALSFLKFEDESSELKNQWKTAYPEHSMAEFEEDIKFVVKSLLDSPFPEMGNQSFRDIFNFSKSQHRNAKKTAENMINNYILGEGDIRVLLAAARMAFEQNPDEYNKKIREKVLEHIEEIRESGTRELREAESESIKKKKQDFDKREVERLFTLLKELC